MAAAKNWVHGLPGGSPRGRQKPWELAKVPVGLGIGSLKRVTVCSGKMAQGSPGSLFFLFPGKKQEPEPPAEACGYTRGWTFPRLICGGWAKIVSPPFPLAVVAEWSVARGDGLPSAAVLQEELSLGLGRSARP